MRIGLVLSTCALATSCAFSFHKSGALSSTGSSAPAAGESSAPAADPAPPASAAAHKLNRSDELPGDASPHLPAPLVTATRPLAGADWNGTYTSEQPSCFREPVFDAAGPDVQTVRAETWGYSPGFKCPGSCTNAGTATLAKGTFSVPLVWVDDNPTVNADNSFTITLRRYRFDVPLGTTDKTTGFEGLLTYRPPGFKVPHQSTYNELADGIMVSVAAEKTADVHRGTGRRARLMVLFRNPQATDPVNEWTADSQATCSETLFRTDFKPGDGILEADDGGDSSSGSSSSSSGGSSSAKRACKRSCKDQAGSCRSSCRGQSATCASTCNHTESACERGC